MTTTGKRSGQKRSRALVLQADSLRRVSWLVHGFSTRRGGVSSVYGSKTLNLGFTQDDSPAAVKKNRELFLDLLGLGHEAPAWPLVTLRQIHSDLIHRIDQPPKSLLAGDGLITNRGGILLAVLTADCLPVILVDRKKRALAVLHAGWRGTLQRIVEKGVGELRRWFGCAPPDLLAVIGPGIHACCYLVGEEVRDKFQGAFTYADELFCERAESDELRRKYPLLFLTARAPGQAELSRKIFLDLVEANRRQLSAAGVPANHVAAYQLCTGCRTDLLFSHRAEQGRTGRMMAVAGLRP